MLTKERATEIEILLEDVDFTDEQSTFDVYNNIMKELTLEEQLYMQLLLLNNVAEGLNILSSVVKLSFHKQ